MSIFAHLYSFLYEDARTELLSRQFGIPEEKIIQDYLLADPTGGKYLTWILRQVKAKQLRFPEDQEKVHATLNKFDQYKKVRGFTGPKDLNQYKSYGELARTVATAEGTGLQSKKDAARQRASEGARVVADLGDGKIVYAITTNEALLALGARDTEWCVKNPAYFDQYARDGLPYYMLVKDGEPDKLLHIPSEQCADVWDETTSFEEFEQAGIDCHDMYSPWQLSNELVEIKEAGLDEKFESLYNSYIELIREESKEELESGLDGEDRKWSISWVSEDFSPFYNIARLFPDRRCPDLEEIAIEYSFGGDELHPVTALHYAMQVMKQRWPEAERYCDELVSPSGSPYYDAYSFSRYCSNFGFRWELAEQMMLHNIDASGINQASDIYYAIRYWITVGPKEPWIALEDAITRSGLKDTAAMRNDLAYDYSNHTGSGFFK